MKQKVIKNNVNLRSLYLTALPNLRDVRIEGSFICGFNQLKTLEGAPKYIKSYFSCSNNPLESLEGLPEYIGNILYLPKHLKNIYTEEDVRKMSDIRWKIIFA